MPEEPPTTLKPPAEQTKNNPPGSSRQGDSPIICELCRATKKGRKLIVSFDGTSNQFGPNNTNVVELYDRIVKNNEQLTYYNSGIGTSAQPGWRSLGYALKVLGNKFDLAFALNFEKNVLGGYRWLADHYLPGDQIFLFGFSRGAYQARALAAMIEKVGLILPGNEEQIPFAYEIYAGRRTWETENAKRSKSRNFLNRWRAKTGLNNPDESKPMADQFKKIFSRDARVHFVGNWDAVSSVGFVRGERLPLIDEYEHICYFRHALALDERRVKFLPEYINQWAQHSDDKKQPGGHVGNVNRVSNSSLIPLAPQIKEVWFLGSHSDIGGGNASNKELTNATVPVIWMGNEAYIAGLKLHAPRMKWDRSMLEDNTPTESLTPLWKCVEFLPIKHLTYTDRDATSRALHRGRGRIIQPWQKIHASVAFAKHYKPKAVFSPEMQDKKWSDIVGRASKDGNNWASDLDLADLIEKDLLDHSRAPRLMKILRSDQFKRDIRGQLKLIALSGDEGACAILNADPKLTTLLRMLHKERAVKLDGTRILIALWQYSERVEGLLDDHHADILRDEIIYMTEHGSWDERSSAWSLCQTLLGCHPFYPLLTDREGRVEHLFALFSDKLVPLFERTFDQKSDKASRPTAALVLRGISGQERIRDEIVKRGIIKHLNRMLLGSERYIAVSALRDLSQYEDIRRAILEIGLVVNLAEMFKEKNEGSRRAATLLLAELFQATFVHQIPDLTAENLRSAISKNGIVRNLSTNLRNEDPVSRNMAAWLLGEMSRHEFRDSALQEEVQRISDGLKQIADLHVQIVVTGTLLNFLPYAEFRDKISVKKVVHILVNMIRPNNPTLLCEALAMLAHLITYGDSEIQISIPDDDLAKRLLRVLKYSKFIQPRTSVLHFLKYCSQYDELWSSRLSWMASKLEKRGLKKEASKLRKIDNNRNNVKPIAFSLAAGSQKYSYWTGRGSGPLNILCLDGGGVFGLSSLFILKALLHQLATSSEATTLPLPCEVFDMICGTSTGGLIALMLGRLRMGIDDAISSYEEFSKSIFEQQTIPGYAKYDGSRLRGRIRRIVSEYGGGGESLLQDPFDGTRRCSRTFVVATAHGPATPKLFRTYAAHGKSADACNIWEAAQATNAMHPFFGPAFIGSPHTKYLDGLLSKWNNPSPLAIEEIREVFPSRKIGCFLSLGTGVPRKAPSQRPQTIADAYIQLARRCDEVHEATHKKFKQKSAMQGEEYFRFSVDSVQGIELRREWEMRKGLRDITSKYMGHYEVEMRAKACVEALGGKHMGTPSTEDLPAYSSKGQVF